MRYAADRTAEPLWCGAAHCVRGGVTMKRWLVVVSVAVLCATTGAAQNRALVLQGGTLIDGTGRPPVADAVVVIEGERITAVGTRGRVSYPAGATVINLDGRTILPGLIDGHVHLRDYQLPMFLPLRRHHDRRHPQRHGLEPRAARGTEERPDQGSAPVRVWRTGDRACSGRRRQTAATCELPTRRALISARWRPPVSITSRSI